MQLELWIILGCSVWLTIGLFVLGESSKRIRYRRVWPPPVIGLEILDVLFMIIWVFLWPLHLVVAPYSERINQQIMPTPDKTRLTLDVRLGIGEKGITKTPMQPSGKIEVNGKLYDAQSQHGHLEVGIPIEVVGTFMKRPVVKAIQTSV